MKKKVINKKLELVRVSPPQSGLETVEELMVFDARCLDKETRMELRHILPGLLNVTRAWQVYFSVHGCLLCGQDDAGYGAGGFCNECKQIVYNRMRTCVRRVKAHRNIPDDIAALSRKFDVAQQLFNGGDREVR